MSQQGKKMTKCALCQANVSEPDESEARPKYLCQACYSEAYKLDMTVARKQVFEPADHVVDNIYLGPEGATLDEQWLLEHDIYRVLTVAAHMERMKKFKDVEYLQFQIDDDPSEDIAHLFQKAFDFIRSGTIVVAYCMQYLGLDYKQALDFVRSRRSVVYPNSGFQTQLQAFEKELSDRQAENIKSKK